MKPAARISDNHVCPMVTPGTPPVPHVGGPVVVGAPTVLIGMMPAARATDMATCVGPPDSIAMGSPSVQISMMLAARMGDPTVHGGVIVAGCPTVLIGESGGSVSFKLQAGGTPADMVAATNMWADALSRRNPDGSKPSTVLAMEALATSDKTTTINIGPNGNSARPDSRPDSQDPTQGSNATINFNPNKTGTYSDGVDRDPESSLAHEAVHAHEYTEGTSGTTRQEREVSAGNAENEHRRAKGIPQRQSYGAWPLHQH